jgi:hypothetical protein
LRAGLEYYRTVFEDAEQNKEYAREIGYANTDNLWRNWLR